MAVFIPGGPGTGIHGKASNHPRIHVQAEEWGKYPNATDFWFYPHEDIVTASIPSLLAGQHGWNSNGTLTVVNGSGADFLSASDYGTPAHILLDASGDYIASPAIFGSWPTIKRIRETLGWKPTKLIADFFNVWTTASNADTTGGVGFVEDGGVITTANDHLAVMYSDGTNFELRSGAATGDSSTAVTTSPFQGRIVLDFGQAKAYLFINTGADITFGSAIDEIALETDEFPAIFAAGTGGNNDTGLGSAHIWYDA